MKNCIIKIVLKYDDKSTGEKEQMLITNLSNAEKVFAKLVKMWKKSKVVTIPYHKCSVASDSIYMIVICN